VTAWLEALCPLQRSWERLQILQEEVVSPGVLRRSGHSAERREEPAVAAAV
jgi:hypothetical protein